MLVRGRRCGGKSLGRLQLQDHRQRTVTDKDFQNVSVSGAALSSGVIRTSSGPSRRSR